MASGSQQCYQMTMTKVNALINQTCVVGKNAESQNIYRMNIEDPKTSQAVIDPSDSADLLKQLNSGKLLMVNSRRRNGLVIFKRFHAEFAGPGAAVGGFFDIDCHKVLPVGDLSLVEPEDQEERQKAFLIRRQWIRLTQQFTDNPVPLQRAQMILNQFENYFDAQTVAQLPDEALALLVGVLPQTMRLVRRSPNNLRKISP